MIFNDYDYDVVLFQIPTCDKLQPNTFEINNQTAGLTREII